MKEKKYDLFTCIVCVIIGFYMFLPVMGLVYYYTTPYLVNYSSEPIDISQPEGVGQVPSQNQDISGTETMPIDSNLSVISLRMQFSDYNYDLSIQQNIDTHLDYAYPTIINNQV